MAEYEIPEYLDIISTFLLNGFEIEKVDRISPDDTIFTIHKYEKLGALVKYSLLFSKSSHETNIFDSLEIISRALNSKPIVISDIIKSSKFKLFSYKDFAKIFGDFMNLGLILLPNLPEILNELGHNRLPESLAGQADNLHEIYIKECLQFLLNFPVKRFGQTRLYEKLPDSVILGKNGMFVLIDSKAYSNGYYISSDDINRFAYYINDFNDRYSEFYGRVFTFLIVSGEFVNGIRSIKLKSDQLYSLSNTKLTCIKSEDLGQIVIELKDTPEVRKSILWRNMFSRNLLDLSTIRNEINRIKKDNLI